MEWGRPKSMTGNTIPATITATATSLASGASQPGTVTSAPDAAPNAGAKASSPPSSPFWVSGTVSPAQAASGPSIMLSAICHATIMPMRTTGVSARAIPTSMAQDRTSPITIQGVRLRVRSLSQPNAIFAMLAAMAPAKAM